MEFSTYIMELINNGLFPIAMCGGLIYVIIQTSKAYREDIARMNEQHDKETKDFTTALNNNTLALQKLTEKIERIDK